MKFIKEEYLFENATKKALANLTISKNNRPVLSSDLDDYDDGVWEAYLTDEEKRYYL